MDTYIIILLGATLLMASITDIKSQRIPNALTFSVMLAALAYHGFTGGIDGLFFSLKGLGLGLGLMLVAYLLGFMGGGDVKLMAAVGACLGSELVFNAFLYTSLAGGLYALIVLAVRRNLIRKVLGSLWTDLLTFAFTGSFSVNGDVSAAGAPRLCYGVAIAAGTFLAMGFAAWDVMFPGS